MTWCDKINADDIMNKMDEEDLNITLDKCEKFCKKYHWCDTVALMNDELQVKRNEKLKCPYCERYMDPSECPDLFVDGDCSSPTEQVDLLHEMWTKGFNIVTCGECGQVFIHRT